MAGVASDVHLAIREILVDVHGHLDHVPGGFLFRIVVAGEIALDMTVVALHAQPGRESPHDRADFARVLDLQNLEILRRPRRTLLAFLILLLLLSGERQQHQKRGNEYTHIRISYTARKFACIRRLAYALE